MHIGLIGGIGVAATIVYYQRLTAAVEKLGATPEITIVHADVRTLIRNNLADNRDAQADIYVALVDRLKAAGAECAAITSLGGHFCFDEASARASLPLISAIPPLDSCFATQGIGSIGLLGTAVVMRTQLFGQLTMTRAKTLNDEIDMLGQAYQNMAVAGRATDYDRALFVQAGRRLVDDMGAESVLLAGTDLNLVFDGFEPGYRVIDALDVHVAELAQLAVLPAGQSSTKVHA